MITPSRWCVHCVQCVQWVQWVQCVQLVPWSGRYANVCTIVFYEEFLSLKYSVKQAVFILFYIKQLAILNLLPDSKLLGFGLTHIVGITFSAKASGVILQILVDAGNSIRFSAIQIITIVTHILSVPISQ